MLIYKGIINERSDCGDDESIFLGDSKEPLVEQLKDEISGKQVNCRYFIAGAPETRSQLIEGLIQRLYGAAKADYSHAYSDYTGYLWTDEELKIGGHDLIEEIRSNKGKFLYLEIEVL